MGCRRDRQDRGALRRGPAPYRRRGGGGLFARPRPGRGLRGDGTDLPRAHDDFDAFLADATVDAVYIASPNTAHLDQALGAIDAGKPVMIEKPVATTAADARAMAKAAEAAGVFCMEALWTRFLPAVRRASEILDSGRHRRARPGRGDAGIQARFRSGKPALRSGARRRRAARSRCLSDLGGDNAAGRGQARLGRLESGADRCRHGGPAGARLRRRAREIWTSFGGELENTVVIHGTKGLLRIDRHFLRAQSVTVWTGRWKRFPRRRALPDGSAGGCRRAGA